MLIENVKYWCAIDWMSDKPHIFGMMKEAFSILLLSISLCGWSQSSQKAEPFVILELFTSEGCSDCPAAEELLNEITLKAMADKSYVYPLSFHVDYWNKLGWRDVFSDSAYSNRQRAYRKAFGNEIVYTPQAIINGEVEFVGSDKVRTESEMAKALSQVPPVYFMIEPTKDWSQLHYELIDTDIPMSELLSEYVLNLAIVERDLVTQVTRGENKNRTLEHENIVRHLQRMKLEMDSTIPIDYTVENLDKDFSIIVFIQHKKSMAIVGANLWNY